MEDALRHFIGPFRSIDIEYYMNSLTPVASSDVVDLQAVRDQLEIQGRDGNWNYDQYMAGMYNGLECALATLEDREPEYRKLPAPVASSEVVPDDKNPAKIDAELWHERYKYVAKEKNDWQQKFESEYRKHQKTEQERGDLQTLVNIQRFKERAGLTTAPAVEVPIPTVPSISELDDKIYEAMPEWSKADGEGYRSFRIASAIHDLLTKSRGGA